MFEIFKTIGSAAVDIFNKRLGVDLPEPAKRKGDYSGMLATTIGITGAHGERIRERKRPLTPVQLEGLADSDPIISAIRKSRKCQIRQCQWDIVPDIDEDITSVNAWLKRARESLNPWGLQVDWTVQGLREDVFEKFQTELQSILESPYQSFEKRSMIRWLQSKIIRYMTDTAQEHAKEVKKVFDCPNDEFTTLTKLIERLVDDLLIWDAGAIVKNPAARDAKRLAEMFLIPGHEIYKFINPDETVPQPPNNAFVHMRNGQNIAEYSADELVYVCENMRYDHYGMSPTETCAYLIAATLKADEVNRKMVYQNAIPPLLFNLGKKINREDASRFITEFKSALNRGEQFMALSQVPSEDFSIEKLGYSPKDMELQEFQKWSISIKCAVFQIAPQDIGFTMDLHRTTSEVQYRITKDRGLKSMLHTLEDAFNREIVKAAYEFKDTKLKFLDVDKMDADQQAHIDQSDIATNAININARRKHIGEKPIEGGDVIFVEDPRGVGGKVPIELLDDISEDMAINLERVGGQVDQAEQGAAAQGQGQPGGKEDVQSPNDDNIPPAAGAAKNGASGESAVPVANTPAQVKKIVKNARRRKVNKIFKFDPTVYSVPVEEPMMPKKKGERKEDEDDDEKISEVTGAPVPIEQNQAATLVANMAIMIAIQYGMGTALNLIHRILGGLAAIGTAKAIDVGRKIKALFLLRGARLAAAGPKIIRLTEYGLRM